MSSIITKSGTSGAIDYSKQPVVVDVKDVTMIFNMASESLTNLKEYFIKLMKHELFFEEFRALKNVSFTVHKGEVVGLVGTNGSGKSTILKIIAGVLEPSEGSVCVNGNIAPLIELGAGFDPELTARENIYLNGSLLGYTKEFIDANLDGIIEFAELHDFMDMPLKNFSSGMVARIAFAIATITDPDVLIVDETLSVGDVFFQEKCERRIQKFIRSGDVTVLFVSHSLEQVERICQRAVWIEKGNLRMDGPVNEVCAAYRDQFQFEFVDVDERTPYREDIEWLVRKRITKGFAIDNGHREFRADETLKRQDFAAFVYRLVGKPEFEIDDSLMGAFDDVNESSPGAKGIWWMLKNNLVSYDKTKPVHKFGGMDELSIADALTFFNSLQQFYGIDKSIDYGLGDRDVSGLAARSDVAHLLHCFYTEVLSDL